jgi:hypothetical protein
LCFGLASERALADGRVEAGAAACFPKALNLNSAPLRVQTETDALAAAFATAGRADDQERRREMTRFADSFFAEELLCCGDDVVGFEAEFSLQLFERGGSAKSFHAGEVAVGADVALPSEA